MPCGSCVSQGWQTELSDYGMLAPLARSEVNRMKSFVAALLGTLIAFAALADAPQPPDPAKVKWQWGVKIPLRDGIKLNATVYTPRDQKAPAPCVFTLTPY